MVAGMGMVRSASTTISSANPPQVLNAMTRSPGLTRVTLSPISLTTPATSPPGENGISGLN